MVKPKLLIIAGPNGSGKTTFTRLLLGHHWSEDCMFINPDDIAQNDYGDWNSPVAVLKAANRASELREQCLCDMKSMLVETVLSTERYPQMASDNNGYAGVAICPIRMSVPFQIFFQRTFASFIYKASLLFVNKSPLVAPVLVVILSSAASNISAENCGLIE